MDISQEISCGYEGVGGCLLSGEPSTRPAGLAAGCALVAACCARKASTWVPGACSVSHMTASPCTVLHQLLPNDASACGSMQRCVCMQARHAEGAHGL